MSSDVQSRSRGRTSTRGSRSSFGSRGGRNSRGHATNGDKAENMANVPIGDDSEVGQLKKKYGAKAHTIKEMFPEWTDEDVVFALQETDGDLEVTVERITDGTITQWGEVSKTKKERSRSKVAKESVTTTIGESTNTSRTSRGRGPHGGARGGRGWGTDRGRGGRGRGGVQTNGTRPKDAVDLSIPTQESSAYKNSSKTYDISDTLEFSKPSEDMRGASVVPSTISTASMAPQTSSIILDGSTKSWASIIAPPRSPAPKKEPSLTKTLTTVITEPVEVLPAQSEEQVSLPQPTPDLPLLSENNTAVEIPTFEEAEIPVAPSKDELTEANLEQVLDTSNPAPTATQASTTASPWDQRSGATSSTPYSIAQQQQPTQATRATTSGFAASAMKATAASGRTPSYQRRVLDQEEAVRMPGNREVDRAAVQFGAFSLNGTSDEDVDGDREEPETRAQPPQYSPVTQPRAALPPAPVQSAAQAENLPGLKDAPSLPTAVHPIAAPSLPSPNTQSSGQTMSQQGSQSSHQYNQYGRYGQLGAQDQASFGQKPYDPFNQQAASTQNQFEGYPAQQTPVQAQQQSTAFSSTPSEYPSYYTADQRNAYQNYYGQQYGQQQGAQGGQSQQDNTASQQRSFSGYNAPQADNASQFPQSSGQQSQSRYATAGDAQASGHATPNPPTQAQPSASTAQAQQGHPTQPQGQPAQYPYGHPYYSSPYYAAYLNQFQQGYSQGNYAAGPYGAKGGMYNQPHQGYGISPQAPYDHAASPATGAFTQSSLHGRDNTLSGGLGDYGRTGSQPAQGAQPLGASGGFGMPEAFGRGSSYQGQVQHYGQQASQPGGGDDLKPFSESKSTNGPSPLLSQVARPGSAANSVPGQSVLPPQSAQQGYGAYPSHLQHGLHGSQTGSQYGTLGGAGHQAAGQGHQGSQYGGYGQGFGNYYGNNQQRGGWGNNYGH